MVFFNMKIMKEKIIATEKAAKLIAELKNQHGPLMFYMSGGCCEGSQPLCFRKGEFYPGSRAEMVGKVEDCEFYLSEEQSSYFLYSRLNLDAGEGMGGGFSLEAPLGMSFSITSELVKKENDLIC